MSPKVLFSLILIISVTIQLAHSLKCYSCYDEATCRNAKKLNCDSIAASETRNILEGSYRDVKHWVANDYSCFVDRHGINNQTMREFRGCIFTGSIDCTNRLVEDRFGEDRLHRKFCSVCQKDLCNSAAGLKSSLGASIVLVLLAKLYVM